MNNKKLKTIISLTLIMSLVICLFSAVITVEAVTDADKEQASQLEKEIDEIQKKIDANKGKLADLKKRADGQQQYIDELQGQVDAVQSKIDLMNKGIAEVQSQINKVNDEISTLEKQIKKLENDIKRYDDEIVKKQLEIAETYTRLGQRIRALYLAGPTSNLELVLSSDTFEYETFLSQIELLNRISEHDNNLVEAINQGIEDIKKLQIEIEDTIKERDAEKTVLNGKKAELDEKKAKQVKAREAVEVEERKIKADMDEILGYVAKLNTESAQYKRINDNAERKIEEYERKIVEILSGKSSSGSGTVSTGMIWPVQYKNTYISSLFGPRNLAGSTYHNGIDICIYGGTHGKNISASAAGKVITAYNSGYNGGYGLYVVIDHGNGVQTYYAHCSSVLVSTGQNVSKGQIIAKIGSTGFSTGPHLHFGVLVNGKWKNPLNYVNKPADCRINT